MEIRPALAGDALGIAAVHCASWRDAYANVLERTYLEGPIEVDRQSFWSGRFANPDEARTVKWTPVLGPAVKVLSVLLCFQRSERNDEVTQEV